jgi:choline kinase
MKALILAAGRGQRLGKESNDRPKCLLRFKGRSLLERHLHYLRQLGIEEVVIAVGYQAQCIHEELEARGISASTVYNPDYTQGSIVSLWALREHMVEEDLLLMDADVLYDRRMLKRLITTPFPNCFLLDRVFEAGDEPVKLCVRAGQLVEFRKHLSHELVYDLCGESVGSFRFSKAMAARLAERACYYLEHGWRDQPYEEAIRDLLRATPHEFGFEDITGLPWIEIDFPEDIRRAEHEILPKLLDE